MNIRKKAVNGVLWNLGERFSTQGIKFIIFIILARLLNPEEFGLFGLISVFLIIADVFVDSGFGLAYVQKKEVNDIDGNTVFFTNFVISVFIYFLIWLIAPFVASFYNEPRFVLLLRSMGILIIINAFIIIQNSQLVRNINFKRKAILTTCAVLISGIIGIVLAMNDYGIWSLIIQAILQVLLLSIGLWFVTDWRPKLNFSRSSFHEMFSFGGWMLGARILTTIFDNIYTLTIGKLFTSTYLGYYTQAKKIQSFGSNNLLQAINTVFFPIMSQYQNNPDKQRNGLEQYLRNTLFIIIPIMSILIINANSLVFLILTEKWMPMVPYMQLLCITGILTPFHSGNIQLLMACGKSQLNFKMTMIKGVLRLLNIIISYRWGLTYILIGEVLISIVGLIISTHYARKISFGIIKQLIALKIILFNGALIMLCGFLIKSFFLSEIVSLCLSMSSMVFIYLLFEYMFDKKTANEITFIKKVFI